MALKEVELTDKQLVTRMKRGDGGAFEEFVRRYESKAYHLALRLTRSQEDAEEVLQDVFVTVHRKIQLFEGKSAFSSWLYRIVVNASFMKLRKNRQHPTISVEDLSPQMKAMCCDGDLNNSGPRTDEPVLGREISKMLEGAITRLPKQYRSVFVLRDVNGLSNQEVGQILRLSVPAVKSRLHRARLMLRKKLRRNFIELYGYAPSEDDSMAGDMAAG